MRRLVLGLLPLTLAACGLPVASVALPDLTVQLPATGVLPLPVTTPVVYQARNQFEGQGPVPGLVNAVSIEGEAEYVGTGAVQSLDVYVRQSLQGCLQMLEYAYCGPNEDAQFVGRVDFSAGKRTTFSFTSPVLLNAARAGQVYAGVRVTGSGFVAGDQLRFFNVRAVGRL